MEKQSYIEKLSKYLIALGIIAIVAVVCWYFSDILIYLVLAFVVSLVSKPLMRLMGKIHIKGKSAPRWLLSIIAILVVIVGLFLIVAQVIPVIASIINEASLFNDMNTLDSSISETVNGWVISLVPGVGEDFDAIGVLLNYLKGVVSGSSVSGFLGSVVSAVADLAIGIFAVVFISFFFVKDDKLVSNIIAAFVPNKIEESVVKTVGNIEHMLSRYFIGLLVEVCCVAAANFLGLWIIGQIGISYALGIAFIAGILNIIPYVGPLIGEGLGVLLCVVLKCGAGAGLEVNVWIFAIIILAIMLGAQLLDNFVFQPVIYSTSIKASPLEIFIVMLMAGHIGGIVGMLAAIPSYTVIRVIAGNFFYDKKIVQRLMPDIVREKEQ